MTFVKRIAGAVGIAALVLAVDQAAKFWMMSNFFIHQSQPVLGDFVRITLILNPNAVLGIPIPSITLYYVFAFLAIGLLLYMSAKEPHLSTRILYGMILGGALGNLLDRFRMGAVVDFIDVGVGNLRWPVFNMADSAISLALIGLLWVSFRSTPAPHPIESFSPSEDLDIDHA